MDTRALLRRLRRGVIFLAFFTVLIWGFFTYRADHHTFAWDHTVHVAVVTLLDEPAGGNGEEAERVVGRFTSSTARPGGNLRSVEAWINREFRRHTGQSRRAIRFSARNPLRMSAPPPEPPSRSASFLERLAGTRRFLDYFQDLAARDDLLLAGYDVTLFIYFYDDDDSDRDELFKYRDSLASRRDRLGVVYAPLNRSELKTVCAHLAHELCHTLGASDKSENARSIYPQGFAEPERSPLYPQEKAEIMAMGRPLGPGREKAVRNLANCVVGRVTAEEMGWLAR